MQNWPVKKSGLEQKRALYLKRGSIATNAPLFPYAKPCRHAILIFMSVLASSYLILYTLRHSHTPHITTEELYEPYYNN